MELRKEIETSTAHRPIRDKIAGYVLEHEESFPELLKMAIDPADASHYKAAWNLEIVLEQKIDWLQPYLDLFSDALEHLTHESALRSISKVCLFIARREFPTKGQGNFATDDQLQKIGSATFDWLISEKKVATKAYCMRTLFLLGKRYDWIYPELKAVLLKDFGNHSAAYQAAAKQLLKRL